LIELSGLNTLKTVSTKLDGKTCNYLADVAQREGTTVSDVLRNMVDRSQNDGRPEEVYVDGDGRQKVDHSDESELMSIEVSPETFVLVSKLAEIKGWSIGDAVTHLYNSYPWHVLGCEDCMKQLFEDGILISTKEDLAEVLNKERAKYYVKAVNKVELPDLPKDVRSLIRVE
jgi:hypothetical protein